MLERWNKIQSTLIYITDTTNYPINNIYHT